MDNQQLFKAIGDIDDSYIIEAIEDKPKEKKLFYRSIMAIAAVIVLMVSLPFIQSSEGQYYFNDIQVISAKEVPVDLSDYKVDILNLEEIDAYLAPIGLPKSEHVTLIDSRLAKDKGETVYDIFTITYILDSGSLMMKTTKLPSYKKSLFTVGQSYKSSEFEDQKFYLGKTSMGMLYAEIMVEDVYMTLSSHDMSMEAFKDFIEDMLKE